MRCVMFADLSASPLFSAPLGTGKWDGGYGNVVAYCWVYVGVAAFGVVEGRFGMILIFSVRGSGNAKCAKA